MSMLERRVQILMDEPRYRRVEAEARRRGTSVAAVIREAIDRAYPADLVRKRAAAQRILSASPMEVPEDPRDLRREIQEAHERGL